MTAKKKTADLRKFNNEDITAADVNEAADGREVLHASSIQIETLYNVLGATGQWVIHDGEGGLIVGDPQDDSVETYRIVVKDYEADKADEKKAEKAEKPAERPVEKKDEPSTKPHKWSSSR